MSLRKKQSVFAKNLALLILYAYEIGYEVTFGEVLRTNNQQLLYFHGYDVKVAENGLKLVKGTKKSWTMSSKHLLKCACDINIFKDGVWLTDKESYKPLAEYWKTLNENNVSGYDWGKDLNHFQMS